MSKYEGPEYHYALLKSRDLRNPVETLRAVRSFASLIYQRGMMFDFYRAATKSEDWEQHCPEDKSDRFWFFETTLVLYELGYRIVEMLDSGELIFTLVSNPPSASDN